MRGRVWLWAQCAVVAWVASTGCRPAPPAPDAAPPDAGPPAAIADLPPPTPRPDLFRRGVSLGLFVSNPDPEYRRMLYGQMLDEIAAVGATDLQLVVRWTQPDVRASALARDPERTAPDALLAWVMDAAKARGLRVFLMPIVHVAKRRMGEWRGTLRPSDLDAWWAAYQGFILHYARLAQAHGAHLFAVGSELGSQERHRARWAALIQAVRGAFKGQLTYSANWDHFEPVPFWDLLDVVGVTAYVQLSAKDDPTDAELDRGWRGFRQQLRRLSIRTGKPYLLTEVGFPAHPDGARRPWDYRPTGQPDPALQARCYRSLFRVWNTDVGLAGLYIWNWFGVGGPHDRGYSPRGRAAAQVLRHWYDGPRSLQ